MSEIKLTVNGYEYEQSHECSYSESDVVIRHGGKQTIYKPISKPDWEIVSFKDTHSPCDFYTKDSDGKFKNVIHNAEFTEWRLLQCKFPIHSVKRLSDGEVFTVEGKFLTDYSYELTVNNFQIVDNKILVWSKERGYWPLNSIKPLPKPKVSLFTTVSFENIYEGDEYYYSPKVTLAWVNKSVKGHPQPPESFYYFKTQEEAEQYQLDNKSILVNYNEFMEGIDMQLSNRLTNSIRDIFKSKINGKING